MEFDTMAKIGVGALVVIMGGGGALAGAFTSVLPDEVAAVMPEVPNVRDMIDDAWSNGPELSLGLAAYMPASPQANVVPVGVPKYAEIEELDAKELWYEWRLVNRELVILSYRGGENNGYEIWTEYRLKFDKWYHNTISPLCGQDSERVRIMCEYIDKWEAEHIYLKYQCEREWSDENRCGSIVTKNYRTYITMIISQWSKYQSDMGYTCHDGWCQRNYNLSRNEDGGR